MASNIFDKADMFREMQARNARFPIEEPELPLNHGGGGGTYPPMETRVTRLETHMEYVRRDLDELKVGQTALAGKLDAIGDKLNLLPTKADLWTWKWQWTAIGFATMAIVIGGIIGGLSWIQPEPSQPTPPPPVVVTIPKG